MQSVELQVSGGVPAETGDSLPGAPERSTGSGRDRATNPEGSAHSEMSRAHCASFRCPVLFPLNPAARSGRAAESCRLVRERPTPARWDQSSILPCSGSSHCNPLAVRTRPKWEVRPALPSWHRALSLWEQCWALCPVCVRLRSAPGSEV